MKTKIILLLLGTFYILLPVQSQVTIGSGFEPLKGSLLELKQDNEIKENSTKGFSLPRVKLTSPTVLTVDDYANRGKYKGLTVQNTNPLAGLTEGIYSWDGEMWKLIVATNGPGTDTQVLVSKGDHVAPEWQDLAQQHVPSVVLFANQTVSSGLITARARHVVKYNTPSLINGLSYNESNGEFTVEKGGYYLVNVYSKAFVNISNPDNQYDGTLTTMLAIKNGNNIQDYIWEFGINVWYGKTTTDIYQTASGLVYLKKGQSFVIFSVYTRDSYIREGSISMTYMLPSE